jgi:hypothetical protein
MDSYTAKERYDILASLWIGPSAAELKPLSSTEIRSNIRSLVTKDSEDSINELKRFDTMFRHTLLATQHEIIGLEEAMSQGTDVPTVALRKILTEYGTSLYCLCGHSITDGPSIARQVIQGASSNETTWPEREQSVWKTACNKIA